MLGDPPGIDGLLQPGLDQDPQRFLLLLNDELVEQRVLLRVGE